jgi:hypothetical protein
MVFQGTIRSGSYNLPSTTLVRQQGFDVVEHAAGLEEGADAHSAQRPIGLVRHGEHDGIVGRRLRLG